MIYLGAFEPKDPRKFFFFQAAMTQGLPVATITPPTHKRHPLDVLDLGYLISSSKPRMRITLE